jgi:hypothetical protein
MLLLPWCTASPWSHHNQQEMMGWILWNQSQNQFFLLLSCSLNICHYNESLTNTTNVRIERKDIIAYPQTFKEVIFVCFFCLLYCNLNSGPHTC